MRKLLIFLLIIPFVVMTVSGCVPLMVGAAVGALGGYAASKDTIQGDSDMPYDALWDAAVEVGTIRGAKNLADRNKGYLEFVADSSRVWISLVRLTRATTRVKVSCRKNHLPNLKLAEELFVKIMEQAQ